MGQASSLERDVAKARSDPVPTHGVVVRRGYSDEECEEYRRLVTRLKGAFVFTEHDPIGNT